MFLYPVHVITTYCCIQKKKVNIFGWWEANNDWKVRNRKLRGLQLWLKHFKSL